MTTPRPPEQHRPPDQHRPPPDHEQLSDRHQPADPVPPRGLVRLMLSRHPWAAAGYLLSYLLVGTVLFVVCVTTVCVAGGLSVTLAGLPLLVAAAVVVRGCADVERGRVLLLLPSGVPSPYLPVRAPGLLAQLRVRWTDPATRRDLAYLVALYPVFLLLDTVVVTVWLSLLSLVASPLWYWAIPQTFPDGSTTHGLALGWFPHGSHGPGSWGVFVGDPGTALAVAAVSLLLFAAANRVLVAAAFAQARVVRALLRPYTDPMAAARRVLAEPGPLRP
jgi:hypothetical protein